jgi:surfeit locus 1 family protein
MSASRARFTVLTLAALAAAALTARLGFWQLDRAAQKIALQASIDERGRLPPLDAAALAHSAAEAAQQHDRRARLQGRWSSAQTVYLDNRQMGSGRPGFYVVTPLVLADGRAVLVQRGWAPRDVHDRTRLPPLDTPAGEVTVVGRIAPPPARLFEFEATEAGPIRQNLDIDGFARETGLRLAPLSVLQTEAISPALRADGLLRDWPAPSTGVAKHYGYAFQWFGLSALVVILYVWFQLIQPFRQRQNR